MYKHDALEQEVQSPRYIQLAEKIKAFIDEQRLRPGSKLPGGRYFAERFKAGKNTVYEALEFLQSNNVIEVRKDSGTYVARQAWYDLVSTAPNWNNYIKSGWQQQGNTQLSYLARTASDTNNIYLGLAALHKGFGYQDIFRTALMSVCADEERFSQINAYDVLGAKSFRDEISTRMKRDGVDVNPSNIAVTWGMMSSLDMLIKSLLGRGDTIYTESPSCLASLTLASSIGVNIVALSTDDEGLSIQELKKHIRKTQRAILITSPDGGVEGKIMSKARRKELTDLCSFADLPVIEVGKGYHLTRSKELPLKALDRDNRVIYLDSIMLPYSLGMDISWVAAPDYLIDRITDISTQTCHYPFNLNNLAVEAMLVDGSYDKFFEQILPLVERRIKLVDSLLEKYVAQYATWDRSCTKTSFWLRMNDCVNIKKMSMESTFYGVIPVAGDFYEPSYSRYISIFAFALSEDEVGEGVRRLGKLCAASCR